MQELIAYQTFPSAAEAQEIADQLILAGIRAEVVKKPLPLDMIITGNDFSDDYILRIAPPDFDKANDVLYQKELDVNTINRDHPLRALSDEELKEVIAKPDEWGMANYSIAMALLLDRGMLISAQLLGEIKEKRIEQLSQKQSGSVWLLIMGYLCALSPLVRNYMYGHDKVSPSVGYIIWFFPGMAGLIISGIFLQSRITLPNGTRIPAYNNTTLKHAFAILILNALSWAVNIALFVYLVM